jgi:hypothetical protein
VTKRNPEPPDDFAADAERLYEKGLDAAATIAREHLPRWVLGLLTGSVFTSVAALIVAPAAIGIAAALVILACFICTYYARRRMHQERRLRAHMAIREKRLQREILERENALDRELLLFAGDPRDRQLRHRTRRTDQARQVLAWVEHRIRRSRSEERPQPAKARRRGGAPAEPPAPDLAKIRRRIDERTAEIAALDAERELLMVSDDPAAAVEAAETRERAKALRSAARKADREARELRRRGARATGRSGSHTFELGATPDGRNRVTRGGYKPSPEELADPDFRPPQG